MNTTKKTVETVTVKLPLSMYASLMTLLDQYSREDFPTKSDLIRAILEDGLKSRWKKFTNEH